MTALMDHATFRSALEDAIKGKSANKSPFSIAWAERQTQPSPFGAVGGEPLSLRGAVRRLPGLCLRPDAGPYDRGQGLPAQPICMRKRSAVPVVTPPGVIKVTTPELNITISPPIGPVPLTVQFASRAWTAPAMS